MTLKLLFLVETLIYNKFNESSDLRYLEQYLLKISMRLNKRGNILTNFIFNLSQ